ncbi:MAG: excinuclease ABC subunit UvrB [Candidatus Spechtbacteria bacterium SB0662_bin_43]|uniref:UvrABC system protein B n=1 Tax=Candidatus Spechtbacteria bacterium SB0662_bin_43 TaxID=2604897 RepID=A0A845DIL2_9BACT|nr:excinuclease ABC subunit UvrB [Candidatus Spechtbacteria bacterium SB0662_bin_43]
MNFHLETPFVPKGDQGDAIQKLTETVQSNTAHQVLYGVTGSGKTFTVASVIENVQKPTLVISHNKTLAWQLYQEFKSFFPNNAVHYFVSYYDYYQPEAYIPTTDTYIEKDAQINEKIDAMRHAAVQSIVTRSDTIIVASVSCIYSLGSPESYQTVSWTLLQDTIITRQEFLKHLVLLGFSRSDLDPRNGMFRVKGSTVEIFPASGEESILVFLGKNTVERILVDKKEVSEVRIFPANFWITPEDKLKIAMSNIRAELKERLAYFKKTHQDIPAYRLEQKTQYDLEMMQQLGYCTGIENYSSHLEFRKPGVAPFTLIDYMPKGFLTVIDESHITIPQIRGMYNGDRARKQTLIEHGFRLPSALDNRPLQFQEFNTRVPARLYVSATPGDHELKQTQKKNVVEQLIRPTGIVEPSIEIRPTEQQMKDAIQEIKTIKEQGQRALVVTITKRLAEDISEYLHNEGIRVSYIHSEIDTLTRPVLMNKLRKGEFDVLVGVNLLREGLDMPEVSLVIILDADKEGFLRNTTTLLQTIGRAARHNDGRAILYADRVTRSMQETIDETNRRRKKQQAYNEKNRITPSSVQKEIHEHPDDLLDADEEEHRAPLVYESQKELEREMKKAAKNLDFEKAALLRDEIKRMKDE